MRLLDDQAMYIYRICREHNGEAAPHLLTADEACAQFNLSLSELIWLCLNGMRLHDLQNPTDVHPEMIPVLDPEGLIKGAPLPRRTSLSIQLKPLQKSLTELRLDTIWGRFWTNKQAAPLRCDKQLPEEVSFLPDENADTWKIHFVEPSLTGPAFIAKGARRIDGVVSYFYEDRIGERRLEFFLYVDLNKNMYGYVKDREGDFLSFDRDMMRIAEDIQPELQELQVARIPILEGFCLQYLFFLGFSFREMIKAERDIAKKIAKKIQIFRDYWRGFFLFDPKDIEAALKKETSVAASLYKQIVKGREEFNLLKNVAQNSVHNNNYYAQKWLEFKARTTDEKEKKLAEAASLLLKGKLLKSVADTVWGRGEGERPERYVSDQWHRMALIAEREGLRMPPKSTRGRKKKE